MAKHPRNLAERQEREVAFPALDDTDVAAVDLALWAADSTGKLRTGMSLTLGGPLLTKFALLTATPGAYGTARSYSETASLALLASFGDKSQALLRIDVP